MERLPLLLEWLARRLRHAPRLAVILVRAEARVLGRFIRRITFAAVERLGVGDQAFHLLLACGIGLTTGLGAVVFLVLIRLVQRLFFQGLHPLLGSSPYLIFLLPALGGLIIGPLIHFFPREAKGDGIPTAMESIALRGGLISPRTVALRTLASAVTIGSGGSVGREAPIAQIGASIGSLTGQFLRVSGERMRSLVGCGAAGGIAAVFNAPIGGVFFALEVLLGDFSTQTFAPIVVSSVLATAVSRAFLGNVLIFQVPAFVLESAPQILFCGVLGVVCGLAATFFMKSLDMAEHWFASSRVPLWLQAAVGGFLTGVVAIWFPQILGSDVTALDEAVAGLLPVLLLVWLALLKIVATSFSLGSGGSGGVLGPSVFIGGMIGAAAGGLANLWMPAQAGSAGGYALVGMAAFLAPVVGAPLTAILILFEMTGDYSIILPLLPAVIVSMLVAGKFSRFSLYTAKLHARGIDLAGGREKGVLKGIRVREVMGTEVATVSSSATFSELSERFLGDPVDYLYLTDSEGALKGVISFADMRPHLMEEALSFVVRAEDLATLDPVAVTPEENLFDALMKLGYKDVAQLPVVAEPHSLKLIGVLRRHDVMGAYRKRILATGRETE